MGKHVEHVTRWRMTPADERHVAIFQRDLLPLLTHHSVNFFDLLKEEIKRELARQQEQSIESTVHSVGSTALERLCMGGYSAQEGKGGDLYEIVAPLLRRERLDISPHTFWMCLRAWWKDEGHSHFAHTLVLGATEV